MDVQNGKLIPIFDAGSEFEAISIRTFLEKENIEAAVRNLQIPMYDGIAMVKNHVWGQVLVMENHVDMAKQLISEYLEALGIERED